VVAVVHGGPGAPGELSTVARHLSSVGGVLEPLLTARCVDGQLEELRAVLEENGRFPLSLVGFSWGAWLSVIFTANYPAYISELILLSSGPFEEKYAVGIMKTRLERLEGEERKEAEVLYKAAASSALSAYDLTRFGQLIFKADSYDPLPDDSQPLPVDPEVYRLVWAEASKLRKSGQLLEMARRIKCPVVAVHGDYDPHPADGVKYPLSEAIDDFRFILLGKCGHYPWREDMHGICSTRY
jgi:pimeloyl-ACP methyl ester carboxylesterase